MTATTGAGAPPIIASPWPDPAVPAISLSECLLATAAESPDRPAIVDAATGQTIRYEELADGVLRVAAGFMALGLRPGQAVAIMAPNSPEWLLACYGAIAAGGVVTGINPLYTPDEVAAQLVDADARFVLTAPAFAPTARAAVERAGGRARMIVLGLAPDDMIPFTSLLAHPGRPLRDRIDPGDQALLPIPAAPPGWLRA